jgi:CRP-like cAMP-binding protein
MATDPLANSLLAHLPRADFNLVRPTMSVGQFAQGKILAEVGDEIDQIYFPLNGMISVLAILRDGKAIETATIGKDGVFGAAAAFGLYKYRRPRHRSGRDGSSIDTCGADEKARGEQQAYPTSLYAIQRNPAGAGSHYSGLQCLAHHRVALLPLASSDPRGD